LNLQSEPEELKILGRNMVGKSGTLLIATSLLSLRSDASSSSRKAHQEAEGSVVNHCSCDKGLGKNKSKASPGDGQ
jgi:hypothetical protein